MWPQGVLRAGSANAALAVLCALVLAPIYGLLIVADRTPTRLGSAWTITRSIRTFFSRAGVDAACLTQPTPHSLQFRHANPVESPGIGRAPDTDETRNSDQRE